MHKEDKFQIICNMSVKVNVKHEILLIQSL